MRVADRSGFNSWLGSVCVGWGWLGAQNLLFWRFLDDGAGWRGFCAGRLGTNAGRFRAAEDSTLKATGTQHAPRSGNLMLLVRVGRNVRPVYRRIHVPPWQDAPPALPQQQ